MAKKSKKRQTKKVAKNTVNSHSSAGIAFVAFFFIGMAIAGVFWGLGLGFLAMLIVRLRYEHA